MVGFEAHSASSSEVGCEAGPGRFDGGAVILLSSSTIDGDDGDEFVERSLSSSLTSVSQRETTAFLGE